MDRHVLAQQLRDRVRQQAVMAGRQALIDDAPDDAIIAAYTTCHECLERLLPDGEVETTIQQAGDAEEWLKRVRHTCRDEDEEQAPSREQAQRLLNAGQRAH